MLLSPHIARRRYVLGYLIYIISELQRELAKLVINRLYLIGFRKNLASSASCSCRRLKAPTVGALPSGRRIATIPVVDFDRSPFHLAFLPGWLIQGCSSVSNPFIGVKIHRIFTFIRFTHSYGYASAGDLPNCFTSFFLNSDPFMQYAG